MKVSPLTKKTSPIRRLRHFYSDVGAPIDNDQEWEWDYVDENGNPISSDGEDEEWEWEYVEEDENLTTDDNKTQ